MSPKKDIKRSNKVAPAPYDPKAAPPKAATGTKGKTKTTTTTTTKTTTTTTTKTKSTSTPSTRAALKKRTLANKGPAKPKSNIEKKKVKKTSPLFRKTPKNFGIGHDIQPRRDLTRYVRWPKYIKLQRQRAILMQRLKVPAAINQFTKTIDKNTAIHLFKLLVKLKPEDKTAKKRRLLRLAKERLAQQEARRKEKKQAEREAKKKEAAQKKKEKEKDKEKKPKEKKPKDETAKQGEGEKTKEGEGEKPKEEGGDKPKPKAKEGDKPKPPKADAGKAKASPGKGKAAPAKGKAAPAKAKATPAKAKGKDAKGKVVDVTAMDISSASTSTPSTDKKPHTVKYGLNHVTALVEQKKAKLVVIAHDVNPIELVVWLPTLCKKMGVAYCIVKGKSRLGTVVHKKTATCLALTTVPKEDKSDLDQLIAKIKPLYETPVGPGGNRLGHKSHKAMLKKKAAMAKDLKLA